MNRKFLYVVALLLLLITAVSNVAAQRGPKFSDWDPVVRLASPINSAFDDQAPVLSKDEKTLFFTSNRPGSLNGSEDIWVSKRKARNSPWGTPVNLGPTINTSGIERLRSLTADGRVLLFMSDRTGSAGQTDIWAVERKHVSDDFGWSEPVNLGSYINSEESELAARYLFGDSGRVRSLLFSSSKPGGFGGPDIYESKISDLGFESAVNVLS
jgi:hypothetical protein